MAEGLEEKHGKSLAAPLIFLIVLVFQLFSRYIELNLKKKGGKSEEEIRLHAEIKELLKEASIYSQPSTFAQAAKLKRMAAAKEKELAKVQDLRGNEIKLSYNSYTKTLMIVKILTYSMLIIWFWRFPVAAINERLVQPFGKILSWRAGVSLNDNVMVGIIPWLILSTRVGKIISRKVFK
ncbi:OLC1v1033204C1 [Oldenlandia corymbosa var. corymbosa]|uniref:OLC1v1033204C1 n=1 Tax=Oldenlandia corymbosa var. corymbosa TaxID=529605 RepID=A0AAV1CMX0_OLDCO|nr:OLC1v1033204C1 [Oldenlandia corymbosa var. corymbosa]